MQSTRTSVRQQAFSTEPKQAPIAGPTGSSGTENTDPTRSPLEIGPPSDPIDLAEIYHHVLAQSPSPENAKIKIGEAFRSGDLPLWSTETWEWLAGNKPPPPFGPPTLDQVYQNLLGIRHLPSDADYNTWDLERSYTTRRDPATKSLFQYKNIVGSRETVLRLLAEAKKKRGKLEPAPWKQRKARDRPEQARVIAKLVELEQNGDITRVKTQDSWDLPEADRKIARKAVFGKRPGKSIYQSFNRGLFAWLKLTTPK